MGWRERLEEPVRDVASRHRAMNTIRALAARVTTPLLPDDYLHLANPLWSARELRGKIVEVRPETSDSATIVIKPGWGFSFDYQPGQYMGIGVLVEGRWTWRSYSLTSVPLTSGEGRSKLVSITVKAMAEGFLSGHLVNGLAPGTVVRLAAPQGEFVLPAVLPDKLLFVTAGSGITPIMSMLRTMASRKQHTDVQLVHSVPTADDVMFGEELKELEAQGLLRTHIQLTRSQGKIDEARLDALVPDWAQRQTWACGPAPLLDSLTHMWTQADRRDHLHIERFALERGEVGAEGGTVTFATTGKTATVDGATTLMAAGEAAGVQMPFGCRMGICQSCVVMLGKGCVRDLRSGTEHVEGERIQTCVSVAAGDCTLEV
ncbi:ferredoxin-NADP reductase [Williamsia limnetica]|uniref:Ferredoxin-NADP reductase n=1 Tax=Williamsia limnetica TaxID=882452 RepID=A0A318RK34_WILLI|nr:ferredoxin reductase [Williamsia limnetica]PYE14285.1 ferredoxin-NADP reductase [Williamsia limnetica]